MDLLICITAHNGETDTDAYNLPEILWLKLVIFYAKDNRLSDFIINHREGTTNSMLVMI